MVVAGSLLLLMLAVRGADPAGVWGHVAGADLRWLGLAVLLDAGVFLLKSAKWRFLFAPVKRLPLSTFFSGIAVGALANAVLPLRLDELVRTYYFGTLTGVRKATVLGTIVVERLVDVGMLLLALLLLGAVLGGGMGLPIERGIVVAAACLVAGATVIALSSRRGIAFVRGTPAAAAERFTTLQRLREDLARGLEVMGPARLAGALGFALAEWAVTLLHVAAVLRAFGVQLPLFGNLAVVCGGYLGFALPSAPGALGTYDLLVKTTLVGFGLDPTIALSCALMLHALLVLPISVAGAFVLGRSGLSLARLRSLADPEASGSGRRHA